MTEAPSLHFSSWNGVFDRMSLNASTLVPERRDRWRRNRWCLPAMIVVASVCLAGCTSLFPGRSDDADNDAKLQALMKSPEPPELIREGTVVQGLRPIEVEGVGVVNGLPGSGGPPDPSMFRDQLLEEMKRHDVADPNHFLEMDETAMVRVLTRIPPGARRGDPLDIHVLAPKESRAEDLHGGWLLDTRLREQRLLQNVVRQSEVMAIGMGSVFSRAAYEPSEDEALKLEGRVLAGGRVQITRKLGLVLRPKYQHAKMAKAMADAVNRRFFFFDGTTRRGIAKPIEDDYIEVEVHPRYRHNVGRMMRVLQAIAVKPGVAESQERLADLAQRLRDPVTAADAAIQLEAMGESAVPTLLEGIEASNPELRFYAAEALGYLDRVEAIEPLEESARDVAAFRHPALMALQGIEQQLAIDALQRLMDEPSLETRYGAFCAIRRRVDGRSALAGRSLESFWLYDVPSSAPAAVVVSLREAPEIVLMGDTTPLQIPEFLMLPGGIMIKKEAGGQAKLRISRFQPGKQDQRAIVPSDIAAVAAGIVHVGGGYGDVIAMLRASKDKGYLQDQLAIDPLPPPVRTYYREQDDAEDGEAEESDEAYEAEAEDRFEE